MLVTVFYECFRKVCPQCNTVVHAIDGVLLLWSLRMKWKALLSEEVREKVCKEGFWNTWADFAQAKTKPNTYDNHNTYHLACTEGSALQCCSFNYPHIIMSDFLGSANLDYISICLWLTRGGLLSYKMALIASSLPSLECSVYREKTNAC